MSQQVRQQNNLRIDQIQQINLPSLQINKNQHKAMGSGTSKPAKTVQPAAKGDTITINHDNFKNFKYVKGHQGEDHIQIKVSIPSQEEYKNWESHLKDCPTQHQFYLMPQEIHLKNQGICGTSHFLQILYENYPHILANQIANRAGFQGKKSEFKEPELWYLLYVLVCAVRDFHKKNKKVGDIRPSNIFINNQGQLKVATYLTFPQQKSNYEKTLHDKEITYLAPEELKELQLSKLEPKCDSTISESFSVGLTCLDASILENSNNLYNKNNIQQEIRRKKELFKQKNYSNEYFRIINDLCCLSPKNRLSGMQVYQMLEPHREKIMNLQPFNLNTKKNQQVESKIFLFPQDPVSPVVRQSQVKQLKVSTNEKKYSPVRFTYTSASSSMKQSQKVEPVVVDSKKVEVKNLYSTPIKGQRANEQGLQKTATSPYVPATNPYAYSESKYTYLNNAEQNSPKRSVGDNRYTVSTSSYRRYQSAYNQPNMVSNDQQKKDLGKIDDQIAASRKMFPA